MSTHTQPTFFSSLFDVSLMLAEALMSLILRFDNELRRHAYPLANDGVVVHIRTYLPHTEFYATFSHKGVLLDRYAPAKTPSVILNAYTHQLLGVLVGQNNTGLEQLQLRGDETHIAQIKPFLAQLGIYPVLEMLLQKIRPKPLTDAEKQAKAQKRDDKLAKLTTKLDEQTRLAEQLTTNNRRLTTELREIKGKQKTTLIALMVMTAVAVLSLVGHLVR